MSKSVWKYNGTFEVTEDMITNGKFNQPMPDIVTEHFYCNYHKLIDLQGGPKHVKGTFNCTETDITSLKGAPLTVGGFFDCYRNKLTSLEHCPILTMTLRNPIRHGNNIFNLDIEGKFVKSEDKEYYSEFLVDYIRVYKNKE